ncbi:adhesion G protein-coupled receptor L1-like isoform X2 [Halichondria panicea]|uniref:adhesion G protein-coupled receptor L1-like isoform X2 n=1 Tax=Halichondria panicea TaxID=6063 RepID=UPI00312B5BA8
MDLSSAIFLTVFLIGQVRSDREQKNFYCCSEVCSLDSGVCDPVLDDFSKDSSTVLMKLRFKLKLSDINAKYMDTVSLKIREFLEPQDIADWEILATFYSNTSTFENQYPLTQNEIEVEPDSASVTVYLPGESYERVQFGWFFSHILKQKTLSPEEQAAKISRVTGSISDISVTILNKGGLESTLWASTTHGNAQGKQELTGASFKSKVLAIVPNNGYEKRNHDIVRRSGKNKRSGCSTSNGKCMCNGIGNPNCNGDGTDSTTPPPPTTVPTTPPPITTVPTTPPPITTVPTTPPPPTTVPTTPPPITTVPTTPPPPTTVPITPPPITTVPTTPPPITTVPTTPPPITTVSTTPPPPTTVPTTSPPITTVPTTPPPPTTVPTTPPPITTVPTTPPPITTVPTTPPPITTVPTTPPPITTVPTTSPPPTTVPKMPPTARIDSDVLVANEVMALESEIRALVNQLDSSAIDSIPAIKMLSDTVSNLLSLKTNTFIVQIDQKQFLGGIARLFNGIKQLKIAERSSPASQLLQLLDIVTLTLFTEGVTNSGNLSVNVTTVNLLDGISIIPGVEVNGTSIQVSSDVIEQVTNENLVRMSSIYFSDLSEVLVDNETAELRQSSVISTAFLCGRRVCNTTAQALELAKMPSVEIVLKHTTESEETVNCSFWEFRNGAQDQLDGFWSQEGCNRVDEKSNSSVTVCRCNHLTHFAILLSPKPPQVNNATGIALGVIGYVGVSISIVCLAATALIFICFRTLWSMRSYIHIQLCITIIISQLVFVTAIDKTGSEVGCATIAVVLHYLFLVTFMWMLMEGVILYIVLVKVFVKSTHKKYYILGFTLISYGAPLFYMGTITLPLGFRSPSWDYGYSTACWLRYDTHFIWAIIAPVIVIIMINIGFFLMAIAIMHKHDIRNQDQKDKKATIKRWLKAAVTLTVVMGLTWFLGVLVIGDNLIAVAFIFTIFVAFQGVIIFIVLVPLSKQVRKAFFMWSRDRVNSSSFLSLHFGDKLETWMSKSRDTQDQLDTAKKNDVNGTQSHYQLGTFDSSGSGSNVLENPTYDDSTCSAQNGAPVDCKDVSLNLESSYYRN